VQIAGVAETPPINKDAILIEQGHIPDGGRRGVLESERGEVELALVQIGFGNRVT